MSADGVKLTTAARGRATAVTLPGAPGMPARAIQDVDDETAPLHDPDDERAIVKPSETCTPPSITSSAVITYLAVHEPEDVNALQFDPAWKGPGTPLKLTPLMGLPFVSTLKVKVRTSPAAVKLPGLTVEVTDCAKAGAANIAAHNRATLTTPASSVRARVKARD
ncbi:hypothetical protein AXG53_07645 [Stenotrophomonas sp. KCTC 12332]|nr:hypothetical protein AXG53_07645 [Stenotrophomonas sp. KCTC 12332]